MSNDGKTAGPPGSAERVSASEPPSSPVAGGGEELVERLRSEGFTNGDTDIRWKAADEIERLQETVTAWSFVIDGIRAHLQDRINMNDQASPATYMEIIDGYVRDIERSSQQYVNARWADSSRYQREME